MVLVQLKSQNNIRIITNVISFNYTHRKTIKPKKLPQTRPLKCAEIITSLKKILYGTSQVKNINCTFVL